MYAQRMSGQPTRLVPQRQLFEWNWMPDIAAQLAGWGSAIERGRVKVAFTLTIAAYGSRPVALRLSAVIAVWVVLATVAACTALPRSGSSLRTVPCWFGVPAGHTATCYQLAVPQDRDHPNSRLLTLPVAVLSVPATRRYADPIVYVTGGPGSAVGLYPGTMKEWWPYIDTVPWLQGRDLILMDQRGAGLSRPNLNCPEIERVGLQLLKLSGDPVHRRALYVTAAENAENAGSLPAIASTSSAPELRRRISRS